VYTEEKKMVPAQRLGHKTSLSEGKRRKKKEGVLAREKSKQEGFSNCCID